MARWAVIRKWSKSQLRELVIHALLDKDGEMLGYAIKSRPWLGRPGFYTLYEGDRAFASSFGFAYTLIEARKRLKERLEG